ncbi:TIGR02301 family protein [Ahrensia marina]|uniref:TIGR02301 family protein n=1 Tax=Ahrensia marina TaxID=1514904 RepID=UPI0035CF2B2F
MTMPMLSSLTRSAHAFIMVLVLGAAPAAAQTQAETDEALARLAEILGALSHLEVVCEEPTRSRDDMEALLASEELTNIRQSVLIDAFNRGFRGVATTHQRCTSASERLIERHHERGASIVASLLDE